MSDRGSRIGRFVRAARTLFLAQLAAGVLALLLAVWAVFAVRDLATERDRLAQRVAEMEHQPAPGSGGVAAPVATTTQPTELSPSFGPFFVPIPIAVPPTDALPESEAPGTSPDTSPTQPPQQQPSDCSGDNAAQPRCRPGRWTHGVVQRPLPPVAPEPQANQQQPQLR